MKRVTSFDTDGPLTRHAPISTVLARPAGYNPHKSYMGFHANKKHWYDDTQAAAARTEEVSCELWAVGYGL
jgi:hypothetical protein